MSTQDRTEDFSLEEKYLTTKLYSFLKIKYNILLLIYTALPLPGISGKQALAAGSKVGVIINHLTSE
jgi:hypothetical protein